MKNSAPRKLLTWNAETDKMLLEAVDIYGVNNWTLGTPTNIREVILTRHELILLY